MVLSGVNNFSCHWFLLWIRRSQPSPKHSAQVIAQKCSSVWSGRQRAWRRWDPRLSWPKTWISHLGGAWPFSKRLMGMKLMVSMLRYTTPCGVRYHELGYALSLFPILWGMLASHRQINFDVQLLAVVATEKFMSLYGCSICSTELQKPWTWFLDDWWQQLHVCHPRADLKSREWNATAVAAARSEKIQSFHLASQGPVCVNGVVWNKS